MKTKSLIGSITLTAILMFSFQLFAQKAPKTTESVCIEASMTCNGCKMKIEKEMAFEKGVKEVVADLDTKTVRIVYTAGKNSPEQLAEAIRKLGFDAKIVGAASCPPEKP